jgi:hypothetical protein
MALQEDIQKEFKEFLFQAFINIPQMYGMDINTVHDNIYNIIKDTLKAKHHNYIVEEEREETNGN